MQRAIAASSRVSPIKFNLELAKAENVALQLQFSQPALCSIPNWYAGLRTDLNVCRTVPTNDQILVPETLLKKRKSQEKARAERTEAADKKKAVRIPCPAPRGIMMHNTTIQLDFVDAVDFIPSFGSDIA